MPRQSKKDTYQITLRIPREWLFQADAIAKDLSLPGLERSRTDALRHAIAIGFKVLQAGKALDEKEKDE